MSRIEAIQQLSESLKRFKAATEEHPRKILMTQDFYDRCEATTDNELVFCGIPVQIVKDSVINKDFVFV